YYRNGRRFEESAHTDKYEKARDLLRTREGDIAKGLAVSPGIGRLRFEDAADDLLTDYEVNKRKSYDDVKLRIDNGLTPWVKGMRLGQIDTSHIQKFTASRLAAGAAAATINRELAALK